MNNTAMTMPSKIWVEDNNGDQDSGVWGVSHEYEADTPYIRADIAEELARALDMAQVWLNYDGRYDMQGINATLASYRAIALDTRASSV